MRYREAVLVLAVAATFILLATSTVSAQDMDHDIEFEDTVVAGETTTVVYTGTVYDPTVETTVRTDVEMTVDGTVVAERSYDLEMEDGVEIREEFEHTFESSGEQEVGIELTFSAFGQSRTASYSETVDVRSPPAVGGTVEIAPDDPGVVEVGSSVGGVTVEDVTLRSDQETSAFVEFEDEDAGTGPERSLRVVRVDLEGDNVTEASVSYSTDAEVEVRLGTEDGWTTEGVEVEADGGEGTATVAEPGNSTRLAFVDVGPEDDEDDGEADGEDEGGEGLPGFTTLAAVLALTAFAMYAGRKRR